MIMFFILLTSYLSIYGQAQEINTSELNSNSFSIVDTSVFTVLPFNPKLWFFKNCTQAELSERDLQLIEKLLKKCIDEYNPEQERFYKKQTTQHPEYKLVEENFIINLKRYKRQYIAVTNEKGEKEVWINCFCSAHNTDWKKSIQIVMDGGNCYFNLKVNLSTGKYYDLIVNGHA